MPWFDHGTLSVTTGKNETVTSMREFQDPLYDQFLSKQETFYCHCMAGRSRSFVETMAFIYFHPDKAKLFDFDNTGWNKILEKIPVDLQVRLKNNPSFSDIAEFITILRPNVKPFAKLDGDQAGLLGLMALSNIVTQNLTPLTQNELLKHALDIGLMLKAPLDQSFRDEMDRYNQKKNFEEIFDAYSEAGLNILLAMLPDAPKESTNMRDSDRFEIRFRNLIPSEQARFAILMKELELTLAQRGENHIEYPLELPDDANHYAIIALEKVEKFTAGDQVEFLRTFASTDVASSAKFSTYEGVAQKLVSGNSVDRYDAGTQLAELYSIAIKKNLNANTAFVEKVIQSNKLPYIEQYKFLKKLIETPDVDLEEVKKYANVVSTNYNNRWFKYFNNPLSSSEAKYAENLVNAATVPVFPPSNQSFPPITITSVSPKKIPLAAENTQENTKNQLP
jgi:hypothetical protein